MKSKDLKSLCETIANTVDETQPKRLAEGYMNSLTEKARQVYSSINEEKDEDEKEETPAQEKAEDKAEMLMKRLAAKALKRAKKKAATNEQTEKASSINQPIKRNPLAKPKIKKPPHDSPKPSGHYVKEEETHLAEKVAPGYENWASDPKVKASFKKQYGKDWKQVMYGRSWNMKKMNEEWKSLKKTKADLDAIRKSGKRVSVQHGEGDTLYRVSKPKKKVNESEQLDEEIQLEEGIIGNIVSGVKNIFSKSKKKPLPPLPPGGRRLSSRSRPGAKPRKLSESEQLDELSDAFLSKAGRGAVVKSFKDIMKAKFLGGDMKRAERSHRVARNIHNENMKRLKARGLGEESEQLDELSNQLLHRAKYAAWVKRKLSKKTGEALDKKINRELLRRGDVHADRPRERRRSRSSEDWMSEDVQLNELSDALKSRAASKAYDSLRHSVTASHGSGSNREQAAKTVRKRLRQVERFTGKKIAMPSPDLVVVSEAGYKRLGRIKAAAYKAELASRGADPNTSMNALMKTSKLKRAAAEREAQVAAGMARRGGASPEAVKGGGSRIGPSGKYTQKAGALANQRDKALAKFRMKARTAQLFDKGEDQSRKRERQQAQAAFEKKARTGDFGQDNQAALRARSNFQKRFGRLKGK